MLKDASDRIDEIRSSIKNERASLSNLNVKISAQFLMQQLKTASNLLDDVEGFFLPTEILEEPRTAAQWAYWLDGANLLLKHAVRIREDVEEISRKYGADPRSFPA
jgi:hypothetical protein